MTYYDLLLKFTVIVMILSKLPFHPPSPAYDTYLSFLSWVVLPVSAEALWIEKERERLRENEK